MKRLLSLLFILACLTLPARAQVITTSGPIQADGTLGAGNPNLGDVWQIQGTITANYVDDDEVNNGYLVVTDPTAAHTMTTGAFLLNQHVNGLNTFAARVAAGCYISAGVCVWESGVWTYSFHFADRLGNTATLTGSYTVAATKNPTGGFLRQYSTTPALYADMSSSQEFFGNGVNNWQPYYNKDTLHQIYGSAEGPQLAYVTVSGTAVTWVSGAQFTVQTLPAAVYNQFYICPTTAVASAPGSGSCQFFSGVTINSATSATLPGSCTGCTGTIPAYLGFMRDLHTGNRAYGYQYPSPSIANQLAFYAQWGSNIDRFADTQAAEIIGTLGTGGTAYNNYNWSSTTTITPWGIPAIDTLFAAAHAVGIQMVWNGPWWGQSSSPNPCPSFVCTANQKSNLQGLYYTIAARYSAYYSLLEFGNEMNAPQTWTDYIGTILYTGVSGFAGGNPADPYGHFFTTSYYPGVPYNGQSPAYGPPSANPDSYLNLGDIAHASATAPVLPTGHADYEFLGYSKGSNGYGYSGCPQNATMGTSLPRFQGEGEGPGVQTSSYPGLGLGLVPGTSTYSAPNDEQHGERLADASYALGQCQFAYYGQLGDQWGFNSVTPVLNVSWLDLAQGRLFLHTFLTGLDPAATPLTATLGSCSGCTYEALGSTNHIRLILNSGTGSGGVSNAIAAGTVQLAVPQASMGYSWTNPVTGAVISSGTTAGSPGTQTFTAPAFGGTNPPDVWLAFDNPSTYTLTTSWTGSNGSYGTVTGGGQITAGATFTITATPALGSSFGSFTTNTCGGTATGNVLTGTMGSSSCAVTANFSVVTAPI